MGEQDQSPDSSGDAGNSKSLLIEDSPQKKAKIETECEETSRIDWISQLPDALIVQILSLLSITDACRTTILSKRWQYLWTSIDNLIYPHEVYNCLDYSTVDKFVSFADNVLPLLSCASIKKVRLDFEFDYDDGVSYYNPRIDKLLEFAVKKKMEDLYLNIWYAVIATEECDQPYSLPQVLCSSSSIVKLRCTNCRISEDCVLNWTSLKSLMLEFLFLRDEHIKQILSNCPDLESLELYNLCGFNHLHMTSPKCRTLKLINHDHPDGNWGSFEGDCWFEIDAPYVQHLELNGKFEDSEIRLRNMSSLVHANLSYFGNECDVIDENIVKDLLVSVRCANELMLSFWFIKVITGLTFVNGNVSLPLLDCKWLEINSNTTRHTFPGLYNLLRLTPNLETLMICPGPPSSVLFRDENIDLWEGKYLSLPLDIFKVSLQHLKNVKVISSFCTHSADAAELLRFFKFLLENAINLEELVIEPDHKGCNICSTKNSKLMEQLLAFSRTSDSAVVISLVSASPNIFISHL